MASRRMQDASTQPEFVRAFHEVGEACRASGLEQLLAIALVVRISELVKGNLKKIAARILQQALIQPPEPLRIVSDTSHLPAEAKQSEIRENVALALTYASGAWIVPYVSEALAQEDKSQRCRLELCRQLATREARLSEWMVLLIKQNWSSASDRASRLRDLYIAIYSTLREKRGSIIVDGKTAPLLAELMQKIVHVPSRGALPPRLLDASIASIELLDEILAADFSLIAEPNSYEPLDVVARWWPIASFPSALESAMGPIVRKLASVIRMRARMGQRSETLGLRLRQALGKQGSTEAILNSIASSETGLDPAIDDWLRGRQREPSATATAAVSLLSSASSRETVKLLAPLALDCAEAAALVAKDTDSQASVELRRVCNRVQAIMLELGIAISGRTGEIVEYSPTVHRMADGLVPKELLVRIVRPMVVRNSSDGSQDIVEKAVVIDK
jgi:hypothetical protein